MTDERSSKLGSIGWIDLTVPQAESIKDFYAAVVGWKPEPVDMGGYSDFSMTAATGEPCAGVCHARGGNEGLPAAWMIYINVDNLDRSLEACRTSGGEIIGDVRSFGSAGRYAFIRDPSGAVCALFEPAP